MSYPHSAAGNSACAATTRGHRQSRRASGLLNHDGMNRLLGIFRPEVEVAIKLLFVVSVTSAWLLTFAWGYEGRQQARRWREVACTHRVNSLDRVAPGLAASGDACGTLDRIGLSASVRGPVDGR